MNDDVVADVTGHRSVYHTNAVPIDDSKKYVHCTAAGKNFFGNALDHARRIFVGEQICTSGNDRWIIGECRSSKLPKEIENIVEEMKAVSANKHYSFRYYFEWQPGSSGYLIFERGE